MSKSVSDTILPVCVSVIFLIAFSFLKICGEIKFYHIACDLPANIISSRETDAVETACGIAPCMASGGFWGVLFDIIPYGWRYNAW